MRYQFEQCISKGKIVKINIDSDLISKEMQEAGNDLNSCEKSLKESNFKWAIIQAYYSIFDHEMKMREGADYGHIYSADTALELVNSASKIYENSKELLKQ